MNENDIVNLICAIIAASAWVIVFLKHLAYKDVKLQTETWKEVAKSWETSARLWEAAAKVRKVVFERQKENEIKKYFEWHKSKGYTSHKPEDIDEFIKEAGDE